MESQKTKQKSTMNGFSVPAITELVKIPSLGPKSAQMLIEAGILAIADLKNQSPQELFEKVCTFRQEKIDRCVLYQFRCAVYFASNEKHDPDLLNWWSWKDR